MHNLLKKPIIVVLLLLVLSVYLYFFQLDKIALTDPDETFYAQTAKEMLARGEWLTPVLYGKPQFEKPILFYSFVELSYKLFGVNEFAARFPSALFGFLGLIAAYFLGRLLFNDRAGLFSAVILATSIEYIILAVGCVTDMMLSTFLLFGVLFFFYGQVRKKEYFYPLSAAAFAFATLTKGPIFMLLPGFILAVYLLIIKDFTIFKKFRTLVLSFAVFALIALPWYIIMYRLHAKSFVDEFFGFHNITRFLVPEHKTGSQIYYNIPVMLGGFMPWSVFLPLGFLEMFRGRDRRVSVFVLLWFFIIFIFFSLSSTKLPTYIFPCFISLALITGKLWDDFLNMGRERLERGMKFSYYFLAVAVTAGLIAGYFFLKKDYPDAVRAALITAAFFILGGTLSFAAFITGKYAMGFLFTAFSIIVMIYPMSTLVLPYIESYETERPVSKVIMSMYKDGDIIGGERDFRAGLAFYTCKLPIQMVDHSTIHGLLSSGSRAWCVIKDRNVVRDLNIVYKSGEKRLVTNRVGIKR